MVNKYGNLIKIDGHPGYWKDPVSEIIYWRGTVKGRKFKKSTGVKRITHAKRFVDEFILSLTADNLTRAKRNHKGVLNPSIESLWDEMIEEREATKHSNTLKGYSVSWRVKLKPFWGDKNINDLTQKNIIKFENWFIEAFPGQVFFNTGKHLKMLINYLVREKYISIKLSVRDLDEVISAKSKKKKHFRVYTEEEREKLLSFAVSDRARVCLIGYFDTGMRKMELLSRKWEDVDFKASTMNVWSQKNKKWRTVPITKAFLGELKSWKKVSPSSEFIFPLQTDPKRHIMGQYFDRDWVATKIEADIKGKARIHDIRHTFATKTARDNRPTAVACTVLDMSAKEYLKTYVHINEKDMASWVKGSFE